MRLIIDLDGTICSEEKQFSRSLAIPIIGAVEALQKIASEGHTIIIYSARTWAEYEVTIKWLKDYLIPFDQLVLGKPQGDVWIDDRALHFDSWERILEKLL